MSTGRCVRVRVRCSGIGLRCYACGTLGVEQGYCPNTIIQLHAERTLKVVMSISLLDLWDRLMIVHAGGCEQAEPWHDDGNKQCLRLTSLFSSF